MNYRQLVGTGINGTVRDMEELTLEEAIEKLKQGWGKPHSYFETGGAGIVWKGEYVIPGGEV